MKSTLTELIRPEIRTLSGYHVPDPSDMIKLNAMENPYQWPSDLVAEWLEILREVELNRYPDAAASQLKSSLGKRFSVPSGVSLMLGNGSDELIQIIITTLQAKNCRVLAPVPTFAMYRHCSLVAGVSFESVPLEINFGLSHNAMLDAIATHKPAVVFLAYPNNPTGNLFNRETVDEIIEASPGLVVVDEAYAPFTKHSYLNDVGQHSNLLVMRTLSKFGLAGLRLGFLVGPDDWLNEMEKVRLPYNVSTLTQVSAEFALEHHRVFDGQTRRICASRERLFESLSAIDGITPYRSNANFILFRTAEGMADGIHAGLLERGVLIKNLNGTERGLENCLRVTVGTEREIKAFLSALNATLL